MKPKFMVLDFETDGLKPERGDRPFLLGVQYEDGRSFKFDLRRDGGGLVPDILGRDHPELRRVIRNISSPTVVKVAHNAKFEIRMARAMGWDTAGDWWCTMNMVVMIDEYSKLSLDAVAWKFFGIRYETEDFIKSWCSKEKRALRKAARDAGEDPDAIREPQHWDFYERSGMPEIMSDYLGQDLDNTMRVLLMARRPCTESFWVPFKTDTDLVPHVADMEDSGIRVDLAFCRRKLRKYSRLARRNKAMMFRAAGGPFNPDSPKQLKAILHRLGYKVTDTRKDTLYALEGSFPKYLLEYRADAKIARWFRTFIKDSVDGVIHASFWQNGQDEGIKTGRFSITDPGLQTLPGGYRGTVGQRGKDVRRAIVPRAGCLMFSVDYAQVEPRVLTHYTGDERLLEALMEDVDIYLPFVRIFFGDEPFEEKTGELLVQRRSDAKTIILAIMYGMGIAKMARNLGVPAFEARGMKALCLKNVPSIAELMNECMRRLARQGYIDDDFGRRYRVPRSRSYKGINAIIQGLAAQIMKRALIQVGSLLREWNELYNTPGTPQARMLLTVHDEIVLEVPIGQEDELMPIVKRAMELVAPELRVPLKADISWGPHGASWGDKTDWKVGDSKVEVKKKSKSPSGKFKALIGNIN